MRKKIAALSLSIILILGLPGCGKSKKDVSDNTTNVTTEEATNTDAVDVTNTELTTEAPDVDLDSPEAKAEQEKFEDWLWQSYVEDVNSDSLTLNYHLSNPEAYGITPTEATFGDLEYSEEKVKESREAALDCIDEMDGFDYSLLTDKQKHTYDILYAFLQDNLGEGVDNIYLGEPFAYTSGIHSNLPIALAEYNFYDKQDVEDYLTLLELTPEVFDVCLGFEREKSKKGYFMSAHSANEVIDQCTDYINNPESNILIETFEDKVREVDGLTEEEIQEYVKRNHDNVINYVIPSYNKTIETFRQLKNTGKNELGLCYFDGGKEYYEALLRCQVGTDKTPEEIIELLDRKTEETLTELYSAVFSDYGAYEDYCEAVENGTLYGDLDYRETIEYFEDAVKDRFPEIPEINFTVKQAHKSLEKIASPAFFMKPPLDDYENNSIYINVGSDNKTSLWYILAHEGIPGHMYQFAYFYSGNPEPERTLVTFSGYEEGWATYVEIMSYEYFDKYEKPIYADFERLNQELNYYVGSRIEIGVNYEGWDLEATKKYLKDNGLNEAAAEDIMNYVIAEPVNYQIYGLGFLSFVELKEYAQEELGDKFDEKEFHRVVLDAGPCQFYILRNEVEKYVESVK